MQMNISKKEMKYLMYPLIFKEMMTMKMRRMMRMTMRRMMMRMKKHR